MEQLGDTANKPGLLHLIGNFGDHDLVGAVAGILLGTSVLPTLRNLCNFADIPSDLEYTVIGFALLLGTIADEILKRRAAAKK